MNDLIGSICGRKNGRGIRVVCDEFYRAVQMGAMTPDQQRGGWHWDGFVKRRVSWRTRYYHEDEDAFDDHDGEPYLLEACPFCGGQLPLVSSKPKEAK